MLHLTPDTLEAAYEMLRTTLPFRRWKLPPADDLEFRVTNHADRYGHFDDRNDRDWHNIAISARHVKTLQGLVLVMAHEMVHLREKRVYKKFRGAHGARFNGMADLVCKHHGFPRGIF